MPGRSARDGQAELRLNARHVTVRVGKAELRLNARHVREGWLGWVETQCQARQ